MPDESAPDRRVSDAVKVALAEIKEDIREMLDEKLGKFEQNYRMCSTCDERHQAVEDRIKKAERTLFWAGTAAIIGSLGFIGTLGMWILNVLAR